MAQSAEMLTKFMKRSAVKRGKKPSRIQTSYTSPLPAKGRSDVNQRLYRSDSDAPYFVPGLGQVQRERALRKEGRYAARHDRTTNRKDQPDYGSVPMGPYTGPPSARARKIIRRRRTKPTPGSAYNRSRPTLN